MLLLSGLRLGRRAVGGGAALGTDAVDQLRAAELAVLGRALGADAVDQLCAADAAVGVPGRGLLRRRGGLAALAELLHVRNGKHIAAGRAGLVRQLAVDGDDVLQQQDGHHHQLIAETDGDRPQNDDQQAVAAHPDTAVSPVIVLRAEKHENAEEDHSRRGENVQRLKDLLHHQVFEVAGVVQELAEGAHLLPPFLGDDVDKGQDGGDKSQNSGDDKHGAGKHGNFSFSLSCAFNIPGKAAVVKEGKCRWDTASGAARLALPLKKRAPARAMSLS